MVQYGNFPLGTFERLTWEVLEPIEPEGKSVDEIVKEAEEAILRGKVLSRESRVGSLEII